MYNELTNKYLKVFQLIENVYEDIGTNVYLWGGWIPDIHSGKILRNHDDAEYFVLNLYSFRDRVYKIFENLGWEVKILENGDFKIKKEGMKIQFGHLEIQNETTVWLHNGKLGKIIFPSDWLSDTPVKFRELSLHAVKPEFQYVLKLHPEFMNSEWKHREKDLEDIKVLKNMIKSSDLKDIESRMTSTI